MSGLRERDVAATPRVLWFEAHELDTFAGEARGRDAPTARAALRLVIGEDEAVVPRK